MVENIKRISLLAPDIIIFYDSMVLDGLPWEGCRCIGCNYHSVTVRPSLVVHDSHWTNELLGFIMHGACKMCGFTYHYFRRVENARKKIRQNQSNESEVGIMDDISKPLLTDGELNVLAMLRDAHDKFMDLPEHQHKEMSEWVVDIHHLQQRIMSRAAIRAYPNQFNQMRQTN